MTDKKATFTVDQTYQQLPEKFYRKVNPERVNDPEIVLLNRTLMKELGLDEEQVNIDTLTGAVKIAGIEPIAQSYAGHQFGHFTMLGDGRAILLAEFIAKNQKRYDWQLKGAGKTPYSRGGDGRAGLGPMLREYIMSEGLHALGIKTTRSLGVAFTGNDVIRSEVLQGAVLSRIAESHLRVGTFEFAAAYGDVSDVKSLADYAINRHDPFIQYEKNPYLAFARNVMKRQASLIAHWQQVGFVHGVMNTDNMTISGETIDFGPCAFIDIYDPEAVFSSIDVNGRYAYGNQPAMAQWNLARLTEALLPLLFVSEEEAIELATEIVNEFPKYYLSYWFDHLRMKLGLSNVSESNTKLANEWLQMMQKYQADFTQSFARLTIGEYSGSALFESVEWKTWLPKWQARLKAEGHAEVDVRQMMQAANPIVIPRNRWVEDAITLAETSKDMSEVLQLLDVLQNPYAYTKKQIELGLKAIPKEDYITYCGT